MIDKLPAVTVAVTLFAMVGTAEASLINDTVVLSQDTFGIINNEGPEVVGPGVEYSGLLGVDIDASTITLFNNGGFVGCGSDCVTAGPVFLLSSLDWVGVPGAQIVDLLFSNVDGAFLNSTIDDWFSFGPDFVQFGGTTGTGDMQWFGWDDPVVVTIELVTSHDLPEPATIALLGFGLAGLRLAARRRRR